MKKILILSILVLCTRSLKAQTKEEWLNQKQTQKKYLLQQIAALKVYSGYVSKGYAIAKKGLNTIQNIRQGDFKLHADYFNSLFTVNSNIRHYKKVADIIAMQVGITKKTVNAIRNLRHSRRFTDSEMGYLKNVFNTLLICCAKNLDDLYMLITNGNLQMKDDERIEAIDKLYTDMQDKQLFAHSFFDNAKGLALQRCNEANNIIISKKQNGLK